MITYLILKFCRLCWRNWLTRTLTVIGAILLGILLLVAGSH